MYELLIKKHGTETFVTADLGKEKPALNFKRNDIGELKNRKADYSQSLVLPMTPTNCQIFGHVQGDQVLSEIPYRKHEIRLFYNRLEMFGPGSYLILNNNVGGFAVQLLSGVADLFNKMQTPDNMAELCGIEKRGKRNFLSGANFDALGVIYPAASFTAEIGKTLNTNPPYNFPFVSVEYLLNKITDGYTLKHNIPQAVIEKMALSVTELDIYSLLLLEAKAENETVREDVWIADFKNSDIINSGLTNLQAKTRMASSGYNYDGGMKYDCAFTGEFRFEFYFEGSWEFQTGSGDVDPVVTITLKNLTTDQVYFTETQSTTFMDFQINELINVNAGDEIELQFHVIVNLYSFVGSYSLNISEIKSADKNVNVNGPLDPSYNLGFKNQFDFFKAMLQAFGATISIQEDKKIIEMYTFDKVVENKQHHRDWTNKYVGTIGSTYVLPNYAQENNITKKDNAPDSFIDSGTFNIDDTTLQNETELIQLPFEAARDYSVRVINRPTGGPLLINPNVTVTSVPMITKEESTSGEIKYKFTKRPPHLVTIEPVTLEYDTGSIPTYKALDIPGQEIVDTYYFALINSLLKNTKVIRAFFWLDENDIDQYRQTDPDADCTGTFIPVFLKQYGKYFYINSINNFVGSGQPTEVELIKI